jgi:hypothetical protein
VLPDVAAAPPPPEEGEVMLDAELLWEIAGIDAAVARRKMQVGRNRISSPHGLRT